MIFTVLLLISLQIRYGSRRGNQGRKNVNKKAHRNFYCKITTQINKKNVHKNLYSTCFMEMLHFKRRRIDWCMYVLYLFYMGKVEITSFLLCEHFLYTLTIQFYVHDKVVLCDGYIFLFCWGLFSWSLNVGLFSIYLNLLGTLFYFEYIYNFSVNYRKVSFLQNQALLSKCFIYFQCDTFD